MQIAFRKIELKKDWPMLAKWNEDHTRINYPAFHGNDAYLKSLKAWIRQEPDGQLVILADGKEAGTLSLLTEGPDDANRFGTLLRLHVDVSFRGKRLGTKAVEKTLAYFKEKGVTRVKLMVTKTNDCAVKLYEHNGFAVTRYQMERRI